MNVLLFFLQVSDRDTLRSIAAKFDTTPSELKKLNRLMSDVIFPGQVRRGFTVGRGKGEREGEGERGANV